jgi:hypothetical protein
MLWSRIRGDRLGCLLLEEIDSLEAAGLGFDFKALGRKSRSLSVDCELHELHLLANLERPFVPPVGVGGGWVGRRLPFVSVDGNPYFGPWDDPASDVEYLTFDGTKREPVGNTLCICQPERALLRGR